MWKKRVETMKKHARSHKIVVGVAIVIIGCIGWYGYTKSRSPVTGVHYVTAPVERKNIIASVSGTGQVLEKNQIALQSAVSSTVTKVSTTVGEAVKAGDVLVALDQTSALANLEQAEAGVS